MAWNWVDGANPVYERMSHFRRWRWRVKTRPTSIAGEVVRSTRSVGRTNPPLFAGAGRWRWSWVGGANPAYECREASERLQVLHQIVLLRRTQVQLQHRVVVRHHVLERRRAAVVEVRRVLPQAAQRRGAVGLVDGAGCVRAIHAGFR